MNVCMCRFNVMVMVVFSLFASGVKPVDSANFDRDPHYTFPAVTTPYIPECHKPRQYVIYRTVDRIAVDGVLDETSWANAEWTNRFDHILVTRGYTKPFLATRAKMLWDEENLYFAAEMEEPNLVGHVVENDAVVCADNDFEIFIDFDNDAQNYIELQFNALGTVFDIFFYKEFRRGGLPHGYPPTFMSIPDSPPWDLEGLLIAVRVDGSLNYPFDTDRGWTLEVSIPWESLQKSSLSGEKLNRNGNYFRVGMSRVQFPWPRDVWPISDWSNRGGSCWDWTWTPNLAYDMHVPELWGRVLLSERTVLQPKDMELENAFPFIDPPKPSGKPKIGSMVRIKGGTYTVGPDITDREASPEGEITVSDFYIDRYEVTISEFAAFLNAGSNDKHYEADMADPYLCGIIRKDEGRYEVIPVKEYYPIVFMRVEAAQAYAAWAGKRLPTEYEWEVAARGKEARLFSWGNGSPDPERANYNHIVGHTTPVGTYRKGRTPEGVYDMSGNVWELCDRIWNEYPWGTKLEGRFKGRQLMRGGSWATSAGNIMGTYRNAMEFSGWAATVGFRCAKDAD